MLVLDTRKLSDDDLRDLYLWFGNLGADLLDSGAAPAAEAFVALLVSLCRSTGMNRLGKKPDGPVIVNPEAVEAVTGTESALLLGMLRGHRDRCKSMNRPAAADLLGQVIALFEP